MVSQIYGINAFEYYIEMQKIKNRAIPGVNKM